MEVPRFLISVHDDLSGLERRKFVVLKKVNFVAIVVAFMLMAINGFSGLVTQSLACLLAILLIFLPVIFLLNYRRYHFAASLFTFGLLAILFSVAYSNILIDRKTHLEVIIIGLSVIAPILYEGWWRRLVFACIFIALVILEALKYTTHDIPLPSDFWFAILNYCVAFLLIYFFSAVFRDELARSIEEADQLNEKLTSSEEQLKKSKLMMDSLLNNLPLFLAMIDRKGNYLIVNKKYEDAFGIPIKDIIGHHYRDVLPPEIVDFHDPLIENCLAGTPQDFYQNISQENGAFTHSYGKYFPILGPDDQVEYVTVFVTDVTELKEAEHKLKELNRTKDKLFSIIAHDLMSPIDTLKNTLYLQDHGELTQEEMKRYTQSIRENLLGLSHMLDNLLSWAKAQFHGVPSHKGEVCLYQVVEESAGLFREIIGKKCIEVNNEVSPDLILHVHENDLRVIVRNLLNNALKFNRERGSIYVSARSQSGSIACTIRDEGVGISASRLEEIRGRVVMDSEMGTSGEKGTGIGLSLCSELATRNGWGIQVSSKEGEGSTFTIVIPVNGTV
ncbi:MAG: PAS domain-containing sensor histidine kinase [Marinoscillum sp.]|uniref:sensor histidine kinase n=1 Tax=Marinoscillum sp. TaxID=2024838 RepID=UPI0032FA8B27